MDRQSWDDYFLGIAKAVAERSTCDRGKNGAIIVVDKRIVTTGYAGSLPGMPHCDEVGHLMREVVDENGNKSRHCVRTIHAEKNAILQAAKYGISIKGGVLYCKMTPCLDCATNIVMVGLVRVVAIRHYHADGKSAELFKTAGVQLEVREDGIEEYKDQ